jgi:hypothetical protein
MYSAFFEAYERLVINTTSGVDLDFKIKGYLNFEKYRLTPEREQYQPDQIRLAILPLTAEAASEQVASNIFGEGTGTLVLTAFEDDYGEECFNLFPEGDDTYDIPIASIEDVDRLKEYLLEWAGTLTDSHADERLEILQTHTFAGMLPPY